MTKINSRWLLFHLGTYTSINQVHMKQVPIMVLQSEIAIENSKERKEIVTLYHRPVSYTHLDVYKRQGLQSAVCGSGRCASICGSCIYSPEYEFIYVWKQRSRVQPRNEGV